jgi:sodium pump decarboxylase gamma subunit
MPFCLPTLIAYGGQATDHISFGQNFTYQSAGVLVVMVTLALLAVLLVGISKLVSVTTPAAVPAGAAVSTPVQAASAPDDMEDPRVMAAIAAAVSFAIRGKHRVVSIVPIERSVDHDWGREGRRQIFQGKQVR